MDMDNAWTLVARLDDDELFLAVHVTHPELEWLPSSARVLKPSRGERIFFRKKTFFELPGPRRRCGNKFQPPGPRAGDRARDRARDRPRDPDEPPARPRARPARPRRAPAPAPARDLVRGRKGGCGHCGGGAAAAGAARGDGEGVVSGLRVSGTPGLPQQCWESRRRAFAPRRHVAPVARRNPKPSEGWGVRPARGRDRGGWPPRPPPPPAQAGAGSSGMPRRAGPRTDLRTGASRGRRARRRRRWRTRRG